MKTISLTVPMDYDALTRAADMFHGMATDCKHGGVVHIDKDKEKQVDEIVENDGISAAPAPVINIDGDDAGKQQESSAAPAPANGVTGVELDEDGLPWDARINSSSKKKTVKEKTWKLKRGVDPALVETVKAELKAAMSASPAPAAAPAPVNTAQPSAPAPAPTAQPAAPAPAAEPVKYLVEGVAYTADELKGFESGWNDENIAELPIAEAEPAPAVTTTAMTFPELMAKVTQATTAGAITKEQVDQACIDNGLASLPLLAARPDLIPSVHTKLFG